MRKHLSMLGLLVLAAGLAQKLPPGPILDRPRADELETRQAGGHGWGVYSQVGSLRCQGSSEAIVGFRIRRGTVLDYLQIICAAVNCAGGKCGWTSYLSEGSAGNPTGGQSASLLLCRTDEALSGYRATVKKFDVGKTRMEYVEDVEIQCGKISGPVSAQHPRAVGVLEDGRNWRQAGGKLSPGFFSKLGPQGICPTTSASAVSFAVGHWGLTDITGANVVQAVSLFYPKPRSLQDGRKNSCPANTTDFEPLADLYGRTAKKCPECCKPCVVLQGSTNPITGRTDREVANLPVQRYNCHLYTLSYLNYVTPPIAKDKGKGRTPRPFDRTEIFGNLVELSSTTLRTADMQKYGWKRINRSSIRPGDIVTFGSDTGFEHSAIVIRTGNQIVLRQKPNPFACVTDFTWEEALKFYEARPVNAWRR